MAKLDREARFAEQFRSGGELPSGPVSPWPKDREIMAREYFDDKVQASVGDMAKGFLRNATMAAVGGKVSKEIKDERYEICLGCPHFISGKARCKLCGCYMKAKTWINADPDELCPAKKWHR